MTDTRADGRRDLLLQQIVDYVLEHGVTQLTLRSLASAIGSNNRMLLYYFGSREQLVIAALEGAEARFAGMPQIITAIDDATTPIGQRLIAAWNTIGDPQNLAFHRLFFEVFGLAGFERDRYTAFLGAVGTEWTTHVGAAIGQSGVPNVAAASLAQQIVALWRGLQTSLLSGADPAVVDRAAREATQSLIERIAEASNVTGTLQERLPR